MEHCSQIEASYRDALAGQISRRPVIEMTIPSSLDPTLAPKGKHVASLFTQYTPYDIQGGWTDERCEQYAQQCFSVIEEYCPGFIDSVTHYEVLSPVHLENIFGLSGGNIFHSAMGLDQLYWLRPTAGWSKYRTPVQGLYLCGAGTHPGQTKHKQFTSMSTIHSFIALSSCMCALYVCLCVVGGGVMGSPGRNCAQVVGWDWEAGKYR